MLRHSTGHLLRNNGERENWLISDRDLDGVKSEVQNSGVVVKQAEFKDKENTRRATHMLSGGVSAIALKDRHDIDRPCSRSQNAAYLCSKRGSKVLNRTERPANLDEPKTAEVNCLCPVTCTTVECCSCTTSPCQN